MKLTNKENFKVHLAYANPFFGALSKRVLPYDKIGKVEHEKHGKLEDIKDELTDQQGKLRDLKKAKIDMQGNYVVTLDSTHAGKGSFEGVDADFKVQKMIHMRVQEGCLEFQKRDLAITTTIEKKIFGKVFKKDVTASLMKIEAVSQDTFAITVKWGIISHTENVSATDLLTNINVKWS